MTRKKTTSMRIVATVCSSTVTISSNDSQAHLVGTGTVNVIGSLNNAEDKSMPTQVNLSLPVVMDAYETSNTTNLTMNGGAGDIASMREQVNQWMKLIQPTMHNTINQRVSWAE
ncbi:hypothetical protein K2173_013829 [Erythroxylum novogranatense]|uniref:Uncharacterized protein n=1 Tax=Erythroxylum novogranatense TaxID=1862640 RepID=A0AAV8SCZ6_9ROSI|nr:hypothetical protein K2173_013829 [Erythroxylum novogranatense]